MDAYTPATSPILAAADGANDAALVKKLLELNFRQLFLSLDPDRLVEDFDECRPDVLVLAFNTLEKSVRYYLELLHLSGTVHLQPHRTVILCNKDEVRQAYEFCRDGLFSDYVLFWPMAGDVLRLPMAVHNVLRELAALRSGWPTVADIAVNAHRLAKRLEILLHQPAADGRTAVDTAHQGGGPHPPKEETRQEKTPAAQPAAPPVAPAKRAKPLILVVDDDEFQHKIVKTILDDNYRTAFAADGMEALNVLYKTRPDLILMDVMMPGVDGLAVTRQIRNTPRFADIPIVIITGKSEKNILIDSLKAGATGFVVKPFDRDTLRNKVAQVLHLA